MSEESAAISTESAPAPEAAPEVTAETPVLDPPAPEEWDRKLPIKIDGVETVFDLSDPDVRKKLITELQLDGSARDRHRRASQAMKIIEDFQNTVTNDPFKAFEKLGLDPAKLEEVFENKYLERREYEKLPEEERRNRELKAENARLEEEAYARKQELEQRGMAAKKAEIKARLEQALVQLVDSSDLPKDDPEELAGHFDRMGQILNENWENGYAMTPDEAMAQYKVEHKRVISRKVKNTKAEDLLSELSPEQVTALREHLAKAAVQTRSVVPKEANDAKVSQGSKSGYISQEEARARAFKAFGL